MCRCLRKSLVYDIPGADRWLACDLHATLWRKTFLFTTRGEGPIALLCVPTTELTSRPATCGSSHPAGANWRRLSTKAGEPSVPDLRVGTMRVCG